MLGRDGEQKFPVFDHRSHLHDFEYISGSILIKVYIEWYSFIMIYERVVIYSNAFPIRHFYIADMFSVPFKRGTFDAICELPERKGFEMVTCNYGL